MLDSQLPALRAGIVLLLAGTLAGVAELQAQSATTGTGVAETQRRISFTTSEGTSLNFDISPDGRWIVFDLLGQLWRIPAEGGEAVRLTDAVADAAEDVDPTVSPDGRWIAFQGDRNGVEGLWLMPTGGGAPRLLRGTEASTRVRWKTYFRPAWSRDSRQLAFIRENLLFLHSIDRDSTAQLTLQQASPGTPVCIDWLADGQLLALVRPRGAPGGALRFIDPGSGQAREVPAGGLTPISTGPGLISACPASSPDGSRVAVFVEEPAGVFQLHVLPLAAGDPLRVTDDTDVFPSRVRWTGDGRELLYVAGGRIHRVSSSGGERRAVPFTATVAFEREERVLPPVRFPDPEALLPARGHMGLALSPDGSRIALLALGRLWVWPVGARPRAVTTVPITAAWPSWAPDGRAVAWSSEHWSGASIGELYVTDVATSRTRQVTRLGGTASRPSWSPDGRHIAFYYQPARGSATGPAGPPSHFAVVPADADTVSDVAALHVLPNTPIPWIAALAQERPAWSPRSDALLFHQPGCAKSSCIYGGPPSDELRIVPLAGEPISLAPLTDAATFVQWAADSSLIFIRGNQLWRAALRDGSLGDAVPLSDEPALYPSVARDGSILYVGVDGYRVRRPNGQVTRLGWPLSYRVPEPSPILIRNATIIDGTGAPPRGTADVLIEKGRITRIAAAGSIRARRGAAVVNAEGRVLMPGLIDLHVHNGLSTLVPLSQLYHGITTVRDMGGPLASLVGIADLIESGSYSGPRVVFGGVRINPGAPFAFTGADIQGTRNHAESERALLLARALGASFVKMQFPARWAAGAELVRQAHALGLRIGGHCAQQLPLIAAGIAQLEHLSGCGPRSQGPPQADLITLYRDAGVTVVPTFAIFSSAIAAADTASLGAPDVAPFIPLAERSRGRVAVAEFWFTAQRKHRASVGALYAGGVRVATGSDAQHFPGVIHLELEDHVAAGLTPLAAITAATSEAARVLGADAEIGTVAVGKRADLILLDADPLENIRNTRRIRMVIQRGRIVDREALLQSAREQTEHNPASPR